MIKIDLVDEVLLNVYTEYYIVTANCMGPVFLLLLISCSSLLIAGITELNLYHMSRFNIRSNSN